MWNVLILIAIRSPLVDPARVPNNALQYVQVLRVFETANEGLQPRHAPGSTPHFEEAPFQPIEDTPQLHAKVGWLAETEPRCAEKISSNIA